MISRMNNTTKTVKKFKTTAGKPADIQRNWWIVDAKDQILGRLATEVAQLLIGKGKPNYSTNIDGGDYVIVINSKDIQITGRNKAKQKTYYRHSGFPGGLKEITFEKQMAKDPTFPIMAAVKNMLPKNKLQNGRMLRLFVYSGDKHKHEAQKPAVYKLSQKLA